MTRPLRQYGYLVALGLPLSMCTPGPGIPIHTLTTFPGALLEGQLVADGPCLFLESGATRFGVAWPLDTEWDPAAGRLTVREVSASIGDTVALGGGIYNINSDFRNPENWKVAPMEECLGDAFFKAGSLELVDS